MARADAERSSLGRTTTTILLLAVFAFLALGISQCKLATDRVTGLGVEAGLGPCIRQCAEDANAQLRDESVLHVANVQACADDPECLEQEEARHEAAVAQIQAGRDTCYERCHHQGGGSLQ